MELFYKLIIAHLVCRPLILMVTGIPDSRGSNVDFGHLLCYERRKIISMLFNCSWYSWFVLYWGPRKMADGVMCSTSLSKCYKAQNAVTPITHGTSYGGLNAIIFICENCFHKKKWRKLDKRMYNDRIKTEECNCVLLSAEVPGSIPGAARFSE
jgi:hypothetical protein